MHISGNKNNYIKEKTCTYDLTLEKADNRLPGYIWTHNNNI